MSDAGDLRFSEMRSKRGQSPPPQPPDEPSFSAREFSSVRSLPPPPQMVPPASEAPEEEGLKLPVDQWRIAMALKRRWVWLVAAACVGTVLGFLGGTVSVPYKINVAFIMNPSAAAFESGMVGVSYKPHQLSVGTLADLTTSPELLHRVATKSQPPLSEGGLKRSVQSKADLKSEMVTLTIAGKTPQSLMVLVTNYVSAVLEMGQELQVSGTSNLNAFFKEKIKQCGTELTKATEELSKFQKESSMVNPDSEIQIYSKHLAELLSQSLAAQQSLELTGAEIEARNKGTARPNPIVQELAEAESERRKLLQKVTEAHPSVQRLTARIAELESKLRSGDTNVSPGAPTTIDQQRLADLTIEKDKFRKQLETLEKQKLLLQDKLTGISSNGITYVRLKASVDSLKYNLDNMREKQTQAQLFQDNAPGYYKLFGMENIEIRARWKGVIKFAMIGFFLAVLGAGSLIAGIEILDDTLKTANDVERVTGLPILATLGDLDTMSPAEKDTWAFRTWTALSGQLSPSPNHGMVCGFISSCAGEGRSTWVNLLVNAASQRGFRVLTVATRPRETESKTDRPAETGEQQFGAAIGQALAEIKTESPEQVATLTPQVLAFPAEVTRQFTGPNAPPVAHIPLPGWVWNLERRKQWQSALTHWRAIDNLVLLVELPPASLPESVLLAENLPQLIWLVDSGKPRIRATREQLETLRYAKCKLVGAVLNHEPKPVFEL